MLVAYHRIDAAEMPDEDANSPTDEIVNRDPRDAIRDVDRVMPQEVSRRSDGTCLKHTQIPQKFRF